MVSFPVLCQLLEQYQGDELRKAIRRSLEDLIPNHITVADIMASINSVGGSPGRSLRYISSMASS